MNKKTLITILVGALIASAFTVGPADAAKKKKKKNKTPVACAAYEPGDKGAEAETLVVTDAATEEEPVLFEFSLDRNFDEGLMGGVPPAPVNVQVDSAAASAGLYATFEFPTRRDYDLWAYRADGSEAASSHGFNPLAEAKTNPPLPFDLSNTSGNHAGETTPSSESIVGLITPDCDAYTLEMTNWFGEGGDFELKIWLGEGTEEPKPAE